MQCDTMRQSGNILIFILVLLLVIGLLSINLLNNSLQEAKNTGQFQNARNAFYATEACLLRVKRQITSMPLAFPDKPNCNTERCANPYLPDLELATQPLSWWQSHGILCGPHVWQYTELIKHDNTQRYIYRITVYHQRHLLLQLYLDKQLKPNLVIHDSWRRLY